MGIVIETSYLVLHDRAKRGVLSMLQETRVKFPGQPLSVSAISIAEIAHGTRRAASPEEYSRRLRFLNELSRGIEVHPVTLEIATLAGQISGDLVTAGLTTGLPDVLIAATALHFGHSVLTHNLRHFDRIPGLTVLTP